MPYVFENGEPTDITFVAESDRADRSCTVNKDEMLTIM